MRDDIRANIETYLTRFGAGQDGRSEVLNNCELWQKYIADNCKSYYEELSGIAEGASVSTALIVLLNVRHEIGFRLLARQAIRFSGVALDEIGGCTSVGLLPSATAERHTIIAQTIDGIAAARGTLFVGRIKEADHPSSLAVYEAGCVGPSAGLNEEGIGFVYNSLLTATDGTGPNSIPFRSRTKDILEAKTLDAALRAVVRYDRNTSINFMIAHSDGELVNIEAAPHKKRYLYPVDGMITHANHFEPDGGISSEWERFLPDTLFRSQRVGRRLRGRLGSIKIDDLVRELSDHFSYPCSICLHPDPDGPSGRQGITLSAVFIDLSSKQLFATDGPSCEASLQVFQL
jgi:isopenicillin-N N-acyltransferase-like protein